MTFAYCTNWGPFRERSLLYYLYLHLDERFGGSLLSRFYKVLNTNKEEKQATVTECNMKFLLSKITNNKCYLSKTKAFNIFYILQKITLFWKENIFTIILDKFSYTHTFFCKTRTIQWIHFTSLWHRLNVDINITLHIKTGLR